MFATCDTGDSESVSFSEAHWACYSQLLECMKPIRDVSLILEASSYVTISDVLLFVLRLLYVGFGSTTRVQSTHPYKWTFINAFRKKLLLLCDDVEQVFLWSLCAFLDGRRSNLHWLNDIWDHKKDWPNVCQKWNNASELKSEVMEEVKNMVSGHCFVLLLHLYVDIRFVIMK